MYLSRIDVINFRGIAELHLHLEDETTVCFGENAWGKTSLVEALQSTLGARPLTEADFHRLANDRSTIAQRMAITLECAGEPPEALRPVCWRDGEGGLRLRLQWSGRRLDRARARFQRRFLGADGRALELPAEQVEALADLVVRRHPLHVFRELRLADGMLAPTFAPEVAVSEDPARAVGRVFERLLSVPHQVHPGELARGLQALNQLAEQRPELFQSATGEAKAGLRRASDMADAPLGMQDGRSLADLARQAGAGMRQVALLALVGAMLKAEAAAPREPGAVPLLVLEDPEAHLHPIQLAIAWSLISQLPAQRLVTTAHGALLASVPTRSFRRLVRRAHHTAVFPDPEAPRLSGDHARRVAFHVRTHNADSLFARVWLLVEGETEAWLLPELGRVSGLAFPLEGIRCVAFAQSGLKPLILFADRLGIPWHVVADGDEAGDRYAAKVRSLLQGRPEKAHLTVLPHRDLEHHLWHSGYADTFRRAAGPVFREAPPEVAIPKGLKARSKPGMALEVAEEAGRRGPRGVPALLRRCFTTLRRLSERP